MTPVTPSSVCDMQAFDEAVAAELPCVSVMPYNSHEICKWFAANVRERIATRIPILQPHPSRAALAERTSRPSAPADVLTDDELHAIRNWPQTIEVAADYHSVSETEADGMDMPDCAAHHKARYEHLRAEAKRIQETY